jgi:hypothetical protein
MSTSNLHDVILGNTYRDCITGYVGIAVARYEYLHGSPQARLEGLKLDNYDQTTSNTFEISRLVPYKPVTRKTRKPGKKKVSKTTKATRAKASRATSEDKKSKLSVVA